MTQDVETTLVERYSLRVIVVRVRFTPSDFKRAMSRYFELFLGF